MSNASERMTDVITEVFSALNTLGGEADKMAAVRETFRRSHRTLQQSFMRVVILPVLTELAEAHVAGHTDPRNEASACQAHTMLSALKESEKHLPFI